MPSVSLAAYTLRVRYKSKRETLPLGAFGEAAHDLFPILTEYLGALRANASVDEANKELLEVRDLNVGNRELTGIIEHGEWGRATNVKNFRTGIVNYRKTLEDVEPFPFYYLISVPQNARMGFVILQRNSNVGIRGQLLNFVLGRFSEGYPEFSINIEPAAPGALIEQYVRAGADVKKISFTQMRLPRNLEDRYADPRNAYKEVYAEYVIHARRGGIPILRDIQAAIRGRGVARLVELTPVVASKIKVAVEFGGNTRMLELGETTKMRAYYNITDELQYGADGFPAYGSINEISHGLLAKQYEGLGIEQ